MVCTIMDFQVSLKDLVMQIRSLIQMIWNPLVGMFLPLEEV